MKVSKNKKRGTNPNAGTWDTSNINNNVNILDSSSNSDDFEDLDFDLGDADDISSGISDISINYKGEPDKTYEELNNNTTKESDEAYEELNDSVNVEGEDYEEDITEELEYNQQYDNISTGNELENTSTDSGVSYDEVMNLLKESDTDVGSELTTDGTDSNSDESNYNETSDTNTEDYNNDISESEEVENSTTSDEHNESSNNTKKKKSRKGKTEEERKSYVLYIITDKIQPGLISYFRGNGVKLSQVFTNIEDARDTILMQVEPMRIIILDTGTGKFANMSSRKYLIDLMGICEEDVRISVFYTDAVIKSEMMSSDEAEGKQIEWYKFKSTASVLATMLQHTRNEDFIYDMDQSDIDNSNKESDFSIFDFKGLPVREAVDMDLGAPIIKMSDIIKSIEGTLSGVNEIPGYEIKI